VLDDYRSALWAAEERLDYLEKQMGEAAQRRPQLALLVGLQMLRGVGELTAATVLAEVGDFRRFARAGAFMNFAGLTASEHSSGEKQQRGPITKTGNSDCATCSSRPRTTLATSLSLELGSSSVTRGRRRSRRDGGQGPGTAVPPLLAPGPTCRPGEGGGGGGQGVGRVRVGDGPADERSRPAGGIGGKTGPGGRSDRGGGRQQAARILLLRLR
jgi:hypothetical protein